MAATTSPASVNEALGMLESAMGYLAKADATAMAAGYALVIAGSVARLRAASAEPLR